KPGAPGRGAQVAAGVAEERPRAGAVLVRIAARKRSPAPSLAAEFDEEIGRRDPFQLHAVVVPAAAEKRLVRERRVLEIPGVLVDRVLIADRRKKAAAFQRQAAAELQRLEERLLDLDGVLRRQRGDELAAEIRVDVGRDHELRLADAEAAAR